MEGIGFWVSGFIVWFGIRVIIVWGEVNGVRGIWVKSLIELGLIIVFIFVSFLILG